MSSKGDIFQPWNEYVIARVYKMTMNLRVLYCPTNALKNIKKLVVILKTIKIRKSAPTCFGSRKDHYQGAMTSILLKLQILFSCSAGRGCLIMVPT